MADIAKLVEELSKLTVLEAAELATALEEAWGVSAAAAVAVAAGPAAAAASSGLEGVLRSIAEAEDVSPLDNLLLMRKRRDPGFVEHLRAHRATNDFQLVVRFGEIDSSLGGCDRVN